MKYNKCFPLVALMLSVSCGIPQKGNDGDSRIFTQGDSYGGDTMLAAPSQVVLSPEPPSTTAYPSIPIRGFCDPKMDILAQSPFYTANTVASSGGQFCLDFELEIGKSQTITITARNEQGTSSSPLSFTITHDGSTDYLKPDEPEPPPPDENPEENVSLGMEPYTIPMPDTGLETFLTDGKDDKLVAWDDKDPIKIWLNFDEVLVLESLNLKFGADYSTKYKVFTSLETEPIVSDPNFSEWVLMTAVGYGGSPAVGVGDGGDDFLLYINDIQMRSLGILFEAPFLQTQNIDLYEMTIMASMPEDDSGGSNNNGNTTDSIPTCSNSGP